MGENDVSRRQSRCRGRDLGKVIPAPPPPGGGVRVEESGAIWFGGTAPLPGVRDGRILPPLLNLLLASFLASRATLSTPAVAGVHGVWEPSQPQGVRAAADCSIVALMCYRHDSSYPELARLPPSRFREVGFRACLGNISELESSLASDSSSPSKSAMSTHPSSESHVQSQSPPSSIPP